MYIFACWNDRLFAIIYTSEVIDVTYPVVLLDLVLPVKKKNDNFGIYITNKLSLLDLNNKKYFGFDHQTS